MLNGFMFITHLICDYVRMRVSIYTLLNAVGVDQYICMDLGNHLRTFKPHFDLAVLPCFTLPSHEFTKNNQNPHCCRKHSISVQLNPTKKNFLHDFTLNLFFIR